MDQQQHAIPQQISSYQFRLVGDMTLKQFFQVAGGAVIALLFYSSALPGYVKWPFVIFAFMSGIALAFFPIQDRPLEKWIILFFKSIYSPTLYVWSQPTAKRDYFQKEDITLPQSDQSSTASLQTINSQQTPVTSEPAAKPLPELEKQEEEFLSRVDQTIQENIAESPQSSTEPSPIAEIQTQVDQTAQEPEPEPEAEISVPATPLIEVEHTEKQEIPIAQPQQQDQLTPTQPITPMAAKPISDKAQQAQFSQEAGPPSPPDKPNVIVGQVLDPEGKIVENAILEIKDVQQRPVRALKSNRLGHFMIVTPLSNGEYEIVTEKEGLNFSPVKFTANGEIIPPIAIWANNEDDSKKEEEPITDQLQNQQQGEKTIYNQNS